MKSLSKETITQPFNYLPDLPNAQIERAKQALVACINRLSLNSSFLQRLQTEFIRNLTYSSRVSLEAFTEIHSRLEKGFSAFFDDLSCQKIFGLFDEDSDKYLHEDEQLLLFTVLIAKLAHLLEEVNFYGLYEQDPATRRLLAEAIAVTAELEKALRKKFYTDQRMKFQRSKENQLEELNERFSKRFEVFGQFEGQKKQVFFENSIQSQERALERFQGKKSHFNFNKYSHLRNFIMQEKLLNLAGNNEEARNTYKNYQKYLDKELFCLREKIALAFNQASANYNKEQKALFTLLQQKMDREREKLEIEHRDNYQVLLKNLGVQESKLVKFQDKTSLFTTLFFMKSCNINQLKSEQALKRDFTAKINTHLKSNFKQDTLHSSVFQAIFQGRKLSISLCDKPEEVVQNFEALKASRFNVRLSLRNFDEKPVPVNEEGFRGSVNGVRSRKLKDAGSEKQVLSKNQNTLKLTHLYDDQLNEL